MTINQAISYVKCEKDKVIKNRTFIICWCNLLCNISPDWLMSHTGFSEQEVKNKQTKCRSISHEFFCISIIRISYAWQRSITIAAGIGGLFAEPGSSITWALLVPFHSMLDIVPHAAAVNYIRLLYLHTTPEYTVWVKSSKAEVFMKRFIEYPYCPFIQVTSPQAQVHTHTMSNKWDSRLHVEC